MRRPLIHCLVSLLLLLQCAGSAWSATRMAANEAQARHQLASLPPCHEAPSKHTLSASSGCCGLGGCHCVMSCAATSALVSRLGGLDVAARDGLPAEASLPALPSLHYGPPLRPPAQASA